jgi:hypothetical protein
VPAMYRIPPRTSSAPSTIRNILASQFIAATHNRTWIRALGGAIRSGHRRTFGVVRSFRKTGTHPRIKSEGMLFRITL